MESLAALTNVCKTAVTPLKWALSKHVPFHTQQEPVITANQLQDFQNNLTDY